MNVNDGHRIIGEPSRQKIIKCTRWSELTGCLRFHAELSQAAKAPTEFRFLNMAEPIVVGVPGDVEGQGLDMFLRLLDEEQPGGATPLCTQILEVIASIKVFVQFIAPPKNSSRSLSLSQSSINTNISNLPPPPAPSCTSTSSGRRASGPW